MNTKKSQCLLIQTPDNRKFFTHEKNYPQLLEFSNTFGAEISVVVAEDADILTLEKLAPALCDPHYKQKATFELVEPKLIMKKKPRGKSIQIRNWIRNRIMLGQVLKVSHIHEAFPTLSKAALCNHYAAVRAEMIKEGVTFNKVGGGYRPTE